MREGKRLVRLFRTTFSTRICLLKGKIAGQSNVLLRIAPRQSQLFIL
jgi:hypothetical protein